MRDEKVNEQEKERRIRVARNRYHREWRKKNRDKHIKNNEKFWLRKYDQLVEKDIELSEEVKKDG